MIKAAIMEDPLRPKTVPLSAETILWFEFLLDPSLLTAYLSKTENAGLFPTLKLVCHQYFCIFASTQQVRVRLI